MKPDSHTVGPWHARYTFRGPWKTLHVLAGAGFIVGEARVGLHKQSTTEANAALMALAPQMLNVLRKLSDAAALTLELPQSGVKIPASVWCNLHNAANEARAVVRVYEGRP